MDEPRQPIKPCTTFLQAQQPPQSRMDVVLHDDILGLTVAGRLQDGQ
jgi:hypothetical protein